MYKRQFQYFSKDEPSVTYLVLNQHTEDGATGGPSGVMLNPKCRKAIAQAFDREEFTAMFKEGLVTTAYGVIPYGITVGEQEFRAANPEPYADEDTSSAVSYTHLDVYKRQPPARPARSAGPVF